ncbi:MAG: cardiolipin synthase [Candidatus Nitrotoga sp. CP45]|nr:MAG: cardiolipin synthase [Candidatus Nitrotoga sp. CP45]
MCIKKIRFVSIAKFAAAFGLVLLIACTSIPTMVPDMAMHPAHSVQFDGAHGPLTAKQGKAILARLKKNGADTNIFDRHLALEAEIVGSPLVVGNKVELLVDGPKTYNAMFAAIEKAQDHINMETYIIEDDEIGRHFIDLLISKQLSGVRVNLIYDSVGSISTPKEFFKPLQASGVNVLEFNPVNPLLARKYWQVNRRDHRKLLIVDGQVAFVGGINISSVYSSGSSGSFGRFKSTRGNEQWRDTHVRMAGPVVSEFQKLFMATWSEQNGPPLDASVYFPAPADKGNEVVRAIGSSPQEPYSQIYATLLSAINSSETRVFLTNAYFVPDPQLLAALKEAAQRGVDVRLLLPEKIDSAMVYYASRSYYDELLSAGVKIYQRQDALLHAKTALIDGVWSTIGSTNLDWRSFLYNQEIDAIILGQGFGAQMQDLFEKDLESSKLVTLEAWRKRPIGSRIREMAARLWARWL